MEEDLQNGRDKGVFGVVGITNHMSVGFRINNVGIVRRLDMQRKFADQRQDNKREE